PTPSHYPSFPYTTLFRSIALRFGADDLDGTVIEEKIYHDAGATTPQGMRRQELVRPIREAGREPVERDTLYRPVTRTETSVMVRSEEHTSELQSPYDLVC